MKVLLFLSLLCITTIAYSQPKLPGQWSLEVGGGFSFPGSSSMNGTSEEFRTDLSKDYNNKKYPFGDSRALTMNWGAQLSYRFPASAWSIFGEEHAYFSYVDNGFGYDEAFSENASLFDWVSELGMEYTLGQPSETWNAFGRAGLALSQFSGEVNYFGERTDLTIAFRGGLDLGVGGRLNIRFAPLALELTASYLNANLIGKSYTAPSSSPPNTLRQRALNDAANPNDPSDASRTIAYLSVRLGLRLWF